MTEKSEEAKIGWWGKYYTFSEGKDSRLIWIGPMSEDEMLRDFSEFRHNFRESV